MYVAIPEDENFDKVVETEKLNENFIKEFKEEALKDRYTYPHRKNIYDSAYTPEVTINNIIKLDD